MKSRVMKMNRRKKAHIVSLLCIILAAVLCFLRFYLPVFNPGHIFYDNNLLLSEIDRYHSEKAVQMPFGGDSEGNFSFGKFSGAKTVKTIMLHENGSLFYSWDVYVERGRFKIRPLAKLAQAVKVADASNQRKAKCKTVSAIAVALREDTKSFDKADNVFNKDTIF